MTCGLHKIVGIVMISEAAYPLPPLLPDTHTSITTLLSVSSHVVSNTYRLTHRSFAHHNFYKSDKSMDWHGKGTEEERLAISLQDINFH